MSLHPRLKPVVTVLDRFATDPDRPMALRRADSAAVSRRFRRTVIQAGPPAEVEHLVVPVEGGRILVRLYRPAVTGVLPLHVFLHGGGWCVGTLDERDDRCREIAHGARCVVASVDYRMAPEHRFPGPVEDCYAALCHLVERAPELGVDPQRVSVGGESAGANLATVVALAARDRSGPSLVFQWLDVPATDLTMSQPSVREFGEGYLLTRADMEAYIENYLQGHDPEDPMASPLFAPDVSGLPPAVVMTAGLDPLRDEGEAYAERLREAGVEVETHRLDGLVHASFAFTRLLPEAREYQQTAIRSLRRAYDAAAAAR